VDRDNMGHFNSVNDNQIVQVANMFANQPSTPHFFGSPAFFNDRLYVQGVGEYLKAYAFTNGQLNMTPASQATELCGFRGAIPSISANGANNGLVWQLTPTTVANPSFRAYNAENLSQKLYDSYLSTQAGLPDRLNFVKFLVPTIANGKVYLGQVDSLAVFGLRSLIRSIARNPLSGNVHLVYTGPVGTIVTVQKSDDLVAWTDLGPGVSVGNGVFTFDDHLAAGSPSRFYRVQ